MATAAEGHEPGADVGPRPATVVLPSGVLASLAHRGSAGPAATDPPTPPKKITPAALAATPHMRPACWRPMSARSPKPEYKSAASESGVTRDE